MPNGEGTTVTAPAWHGFIPEDVTADPGLAPIVTNMKEKFKDDASLVKGYAHLERRMGSALTLPGKDAKPEEREALKAKLYDAGLFERPPADPKEYGIAKPETLPDGVGWNEESAGKLATLLHKHGAPKALAADLLALHTELMTGTSLALKTSYEQGLQALKTEHGEHFDDRKEAASRMLSVIFKTPEELAAVEAMGLGDHPGFLSVLMRLAPLAMSDSSFLADMQRPGGEMKGEDATAELSKIMSDKTHPHYEGYKRGDPKSMAYVTELYRKAHGTKTVEFGSGAVLSGAGGAQ